MRLALLASMPKVRTALAQDQAPEPGGEAIDAPDLRFLVRAADTCRRLNDDIGMFGPAFRPAFSGIDGGRHRAFFSGTCVFGEGPGSSAAPALAPTCSR